MAEGDLELVYNMCKNFVDVCNKDKKLRDVIFEIDSRSLSDVAEVDSSDYDIVEMMAYTSKMIANCITIKGFFADLLHSDLIDNLNYTKGEIEFLDILNEGVFDDLRSEEEFR